MFRCGEAVAAIQSKSWNRSFGPDLFKDALVSLHPAFFFKHSKDGQPETQKSRNRDVWLQCADEVMNGIAFIRVVFASLGFSITVQYLVREYNAAEEEKERQARETGQRYIPQLIYLRNLDDIKEETGEAAYEKLRAQVPGKISANVQQQLMLQSEWMRLADKSVVKIDELKNMCAVRGIACGKLNQKQLIAALDSYNVQSALANKWELVLGDVIRFENMHLLAYLLFDIVIYFSCSTQVRATLKEAEAEHARKEQSKKPGTSAALRSGDAGCSSEIDKGAKAEEQDDVKSAEAAEDDAVTPSRRKRTKRTTTSKKRK